MPSKSLSPVRRLIPIAVATAREGLPALVGSKAQVRLAEYYRHAQVANLLQVYIWLAAEQRELRAELRRRAALHALSPALETELEPNEERIHVRLEALDEARARVVQAKGCKVAHDWIAGLPTAVVLDWLMRQDTKEEN